jgi:hypothetical protein
VGTGPAAFDGEPGWGRDNVVSLAWRFVLDGDVVRRREGVLQKHALRQITAGYGAETCLTHDYSRGCAEASPRWPADWPRAV